MIRSPSQPSSLYFSTDICNLYTVHYIHLGDALISNNLVELKCIHPIYVAIVPHQANSTPTPASAFTQEHWSSNATTQNPKCVSWMHTGCTHTVTSLKKNLENQIYYIQYTTWMTMHSRYEPSGNYICAGQIFLCITKYIYFILFMVICEFWLVCAHWFCEMAQKSICSKKETTQTSTML